MKEVPFLTVQPRVFANSASVEYWNFRIRIESAAGPGTRTMVDSSRPVEPWAKLVEAIASEKKTPGGGVEQLVHLWEARDKLPEIIAALVLRNLVAATLQHQGTAKARNFLEIGAKLYPSYAELHYLAGLLAIREHRFGEAFPLLERAKSLAVSFPGSGGENSYRCDWLLGVMAAKVGNDGVAFEHFLSGVKHDPLFEPSLTALLKLRLPCGLIEGNQHVFTQAARRNPDAAGRICEFLITHRAFAAARGIAQTVELDSAQRETTESQLASSAAPSRTAVRTIGIAFEGPFFEYSSIARVNREIARALLSAEEFEVRVETSTAAVHPPHLLPDGEVLIPAIHRRLHQTDLTVRHQWPPDFRRPVTGKLAVILPWEYGGVPRVWIEQIRQNVDELWVPSNFVRGVFIRNGLDPDRVTVIPNGYDPEVFKPEGPSLRPQGSRDFVFLFVGGAIRRKGIDLLFHAYQAAFSINQSVSLILLISGSTGAYQRNSWLADIRAATNSSMFPHFHAIVETIDDAVLSSLYRGCDAFVLPYRGEGFGMPLLEAMACGKAVITTAEGPAKDFCNESSAYLVPASEEMVSDTPPPLGPMVADFTWFEPNFTELVRSLRRVHQNRSEAVAKGQAAANATRHLTWEHVTSQYAGRIRRLCASQ
ncbi:MAG TPA: glycosyltransferase [Candidatus Acidoferrum sp.]